MAAARFARGLQEARRLALTGEGKRRREASGLFQGEVARLVGVSGACISRWEAGERVPRGEAAVHWAELLAALGTAEVGS